MSRPWSRAVLLAGVAVLGQAACDPSPPGAETRTPAATSTPVGAGCAPTQGERAGPGGTRMAAADAPSRARLGPGGEVERTAATVAAGRGGQELVVEGT